MLIKFIKDWWNKIELENNHQPEIVYIPDVPIICKRCGGSGELKKYDRKPTQEEFNKANGMIGLAQFGIPYELLTCDECGGVGSMDNFGRQRMDIYRDILERSGLKVTLDEQSFFSNLIKNNIAYEFYININSLKIIKVSIEYNLKGVRGYKHESILDCKYHQINPDIYKSILMNLH